MTTTLRFRNINEKEVEVVARVQGARYHRRGSSVLSQISAVSHLNSRAVRLKNGMTLIYLKLPQHIVNGSILFRKGSGSTFEKTAAQLSARTRRSANDCPAGPAKQLIG